MPPLSIQYVFLACPRPADFTGKISITTHFLVSGSEPYNGTKVEDLDVCINGVTGWVSDEFDDLVKAATTVRAFAGPL